MKPLDLLDQFDKGAAAFAFVATYEFDPQFFERRMLAKRTFGTADRIVVFMDNGRYQELINSGLQASGFNRRYLVVPMNRSPFVFHPKLYLTLGEKRADGLIGSNNCTNAGIAYNNEICSIFSVVADPPSSGNRDAQSVLRQIYEAMKSFANDAGGLRQVLEDEFFGPVESQFPWLHRKVLLPRSTIELIHSHESALWPELLKRLAGRKIGKIAVIAPFFDQELGFLSRLRNQWPHAELTIVAQPDYATLDGPKLEAIFGDGNHKLLAAHPQPGRRLHAKAFAFETEAGTLWFSGSANATLAAFDGGNTESALWIETVESADNVLDGSGLELKHIDPAEFVRGIEQEPVGESVPPSQVTLGSAILREDGMLECEFKIPELARDVTLRVRNINETHPVFSLPFRRGAQGKTSLELDDNQIMQIRGAAVCEIRAVIEPAIEVISNAVALVQLYQLLRDRPGPRSGSDPLRKIEETGENLVAYVDNLGSVRDAVEFFNNCSIRFFDGESSPQAAPGEFWKPRDPFKPDTPPNWLNTTVGGSAADLREALNEFVRRHQNDKLFKHVRRGNLNGLTNFLDIFRTLNGLLFTFNQRSMGSAGPIVPFGYVTTGVMTNLELLIGPFERLKDSYEGDGYIAAIHTNLRGEREAVCERLQEERVPQMVRAAMEAMIDVRAKARKMTLPDAWAMNRRRWVSEWIAGQGLDQPSMEDIRAAGLEYLPEQRAA